ncbi:MAG: ATP-dependent DNA ligase, partial [Armatimonadetes bacterium]|nr:ATP-dependent DNA ligase [Armatimonadota bacterium]
FCVAAEAVAATASRLEKARLLGEYFSDLSDQYLRRAALYFGGHLFPLREGRTVNVGGALVFAAIEAVSQCEENWLRERLVARGDGGELAFEAWERAAIGGDATLDLAQVEAEIALLAQTSGSKAKLARVVEVLGRCGALEAKYFVKMLTGDLRIGLKEGAVEDAIARLAGQSVALVQRANMLSGDLGAVALLARHNQLESARFALFHPLKFMLATPAADLSDVARQMPETFVVEDKFDGIRAQVHVAPHLDGDEILHGVMVGNRRVALFSRTLDEITGAFPDLLMPLAALLPADCTGIVLDGEIVPLRGETIAPFQLLQKRLGRKTPSPAILSEIPVAFIAYDALFAHEILLESPFATRRAALETLNFDGNRARLAVSQCFSDVMQLDEEFDAARSRGNEGLMVKDPRSIYKPGRRGRQWLKIKKAVATLDVVVASVEAGNGRRSKFYSDYTFAVRASETDGTLLNVGKAYSGLTDAEIATLNEWFLSHTTQSFAHGRVRVVEPKIVLEITFDRVQSSPRHKSGFALRFPRILRIRDYKPVEEIDTLETVAKMAE